MSNELLQFFSQTNSTSWEIKSLEAFPDDWLLFMDISEEVRENARDGDRHGLNP
jgi:hypothetical protein